MEVIRISAIAIIPLMAFMALGFFFRRRNYLEPESTRRINILVFRFFLPIMCAETIYKADLHKDVEALPLVIVASGILLSFFISWLIVPRFEKDRTRIPVMIQGIYKCNYAILGIPIAQTICGAENLGIVSVIAVLIVPANNILSALIFEKYTGSSTSVPKMLLKVISNPLVVGSAVGLLFNITGVVIPSWIMTGIVAKLGALATPLSMIALGASFEFTHIRKYSKHLTWAVLARLVLIPAVTVPAAIVLGVRGSSLVGIMIYAASPNAVNSYSTAVALGGDADLANEIVVMSSIISMATMFLWFVAVGSIVGL